MQQLFIATHSNLFDLDPKRYLDVSLDDARADVVRFVEQLNEHEMLERGAPTGARGPSL